MAVFGDGLAASRRWAPTARATSRAARSPVPSCLLKLTLCRAGKARSALLSPPIDRSRIGGRTGSEVDTCPVATTALGAERPHRVWCVRRGLPAATAAEQSAAASTSRTAGPRTSRRAARARGPPTAAADPAADQSPDKERRSAQLARNPGGDQRGGAALAPARRVAPPGQPRMGGRGGNTRGLRRGGDAVGVGRSALQVPRSHPQSPRVPAPARSVRGPDRRDGAFRRSNTARGVSRETGAAFS